MTSLLETLSDYVFSGVPSNATWDLLKQVWVRWKQKSWEDLFLDAFELALERERHVLERYSRDGEITLDRQKLLVVLTQKLIVSPETTSYTHLIDDFFLAQLAEQMALAELLVIGGHNLTPTEYAYFVKNIVLYARELFRDAIRADEPGFKRMLQDVAEDLLGVSEHTHQQVRELVLFIGDRFELILSRLDLQSDTLENIQRDIQMLLQQTPKETYLGKPNRLPIRLFLSSPGDVSEERKIVIQICEQLRLDPLLNEFAQLDIVAWDKPGMIVPFTANTTPQNDVNKALPLPLECEIVVIILWSRMGTPLPHEFSRIDGSRYLSGTQWEYENALEGAKKNKGRPQIIVYRRTEEPTIGMRDPEKDEKYKQLALVDNFFEQFSDAKGAILRGYNQYKTLDEFRGQVDIHIRKIIYIILKNQVNLVNGESHYTDNIDTSARTSPSKSWAGSPFPGLRPFTAEDAPIFFGRERETELLVKLVGQNQLILVVGASGSGKSSLVWAGVVPRIQDKFLVVRFTPGEVGDNPFMALATQLKFHLQQSLWTPKSIAAKLALHPAALDGFCQDMLSDSKSEVMLFIDQFEELFTLVKEEWRPSFIEMITRAKNSKTFRVIITIRSDFYPHCLHWPTLTEMGEKGHFPLSTPRLAALYEMIVRPAAFAALTVETGLVQTILDETGNEPGALALLAYTLDELYHLGGKLSYEDYDALGGVQGAIGKRAESTFVNLEISVQEQLSSVFRELVEVDERGTATRQRVLLSRFSTIKSQEQLVNAFVDARLLLTYSNNANEPIVEVAHEAIFRSWERLRAWIDEARDDLILLRQMRNAANQWDVHGRNREYLWLGERDQLMQGMLSRLKPQMSEIERAFSKPEHEHLIDEIQDASTTNARRSQIGERLSVIGDRRLGVGILPSGIPDIFWCRVPEGTINSVGYTFQLRPYYVSKYLVTYAQFQVFCRSEEYKNPLWWKDVVNEYQCQSLDTQNNKHNNHPRENVSWYQAIAFCRWLNSMYRALSAPPYPDMDQALWNAITTETWKVRLPTEWEYEQAVTGGKMDYRYPWGVDWLAGRANTSEAVIGRTTAVGMFPLGAAQCGAMDLAGNVWEWCQNEYRQTAHVNVSNEGAKALRGGSFSRRAEDALVTARNFDDPAFSYASFGFRVCVGPESNLVATSLLSEI